MAIRTAAFVIGLALASGTSPWPAAVAQTASTEPGAPPGSGTRPTVVCSDDAKPASLDFTLKDVHGKPFTLSDYKGKVVLLDFWATWCPPCRKEIPGFIDLYSRYQSQGLVVIGVSMDDSASDVRKFVKQLKINYPVAMGYGREDDLKPAFGELPLPTSFVIARDGRICAKHDGFTPKDQYEREITSLF